MSVPITWRRRPGDPVWDFRRVSAAAEKETRCRNGRRRHRVPVHDLLRYLIGFHTRILAISTLSFAKKRVRLTQRLTVVLRQASRFYARQPAALGRRPRQPL